MIAGERSGDMHGASLIRALMSASSDISIQCWGGDQMQAAGAKLSVHYRQLAFMGFWEVFKNLFTISKLLEKCKTEIKEYNPDLVVFIDYPGFNLKIAKYVHGLGIPSFYFIPPKAWAWNEKRVHLLRNYIIKAYSILPFEIGFFENHQVPIKYVGNPLVGEINSYVPDSPFIQKYQFRSIIAVLPGSRAQEVQQMGSQLLHLIKRYPNNHFLVAGVDNLDTKLYSIFEDCPNVEVVYNQTYDILSVAHVALVTSGTATLETALFNVPQLVCYRTSPITYFIAKNLVNIKYISLVNLIADQSIVPELIQDDFSPQRMQFELSELIGDTPARQQQIDGYKKIRSLLGDRDASAEVANDLLSHLGRL